MFFTIVIKKEVNIWRILARFAEAVIIAIFFRNIEEFLVRRKRDVFSKVTSREDNGRFE